MSRNNEQLSLIDHNNTNANNKKVREPATDVMKAVAAHAPNERMMQKVFSPQEIDDILLKRDCGEDLTKAESVVLRKQFAKMKRWALEKEKTNNQQLIFVPSITDDKGFYKAYDISALYYVYRLADRMQRQAHVAADNDSYSKALHMARLVNMPLFVEQIKKLVNATLEITEDGIYVFTLPKPLTDDEIGELRRTEQVRRDKLHSIVRPAGMDPGSYNQILMIVRQVAPKTRKLDRENYYLYGERMLADLQTVLSLYFDFSMGILTKPEARVGMVRAMNRIRSALGILSEVGAWDVDAGAVVGENLNELMRRVDKVFPKDAK